MGSIKTVRIKTAHMEEQKTKKSGPRHPDEDHPTENISITNLL